MTEIKKVIDSVICFLGWFLWFLTPSLCFYFCTQHPECNNTLSRRIFRLYDEVKLKTCGLRAPTRPQLSQRKLGTITLHKLLAPSSTPPTYFICPPQVPFTTMLALLCMWFGISMPLVYLGYYFGFRKQPYDNPVRTNQIPRQVPEQRWYMNKFVG